MLSDLLPGFPHLQNIHPLVVHFPLAFLTGAVGLYILAWLLRWDWWAWLPFWLLLLGTLTAGLAVAIGLRAEPGVMVAPSVRAALLEPHEDLMLTTLALAVLLTVWAAIARPLPQRGRVLFVLLLLALLAVMTRGADYGGRMVYDYNAGGNACPQPIDFTQ